MDELTLLDWRRRIFELYAELRREPEPLQAWWRWREARDELFATHAQSPLPAADRAAFSGLSYFEYDPALRVLASVEPTERLRRRLPSSGGEPFPSTCFARASFELAGEACGLDLYWLDGYAGGVYLSAADATSGSETYGAGRYLLDTVKGSDLGESAGRLVLDFNFAYNPSCAYDPRWACPLAPPGNRLAIPVRGGERYGAESPAARSATIGV